MTLELANCNMYGACSRCVRTYPEDAVTIVIWPHITSYGYSYYYDSIIIMYQLQLRQWQIQDIPLNACMTVRKRPMELVQAPCESNTYVHHASLLLINQHIVIECLN